MTAPPMRRTLSPIHTSFDHPYPHVDIHYGSGERLDGLFLDEARAIAARRGIPFDRRVFDGKGKWLR